MVMLSKNPSVSHSTAVRIVVRSTLNEHLSLLPWSPAPSVMHSPPLDKEHAPVGTARVTEKAAATGAVGAVGATVVGASVGDVGAPDVGTEVGTAEPPEQSVNPWLVTLPSVNHENVVPACTVTPSGELVPL
jgi:hypothetical protein